MFKRKVKKEMVLHMLEKETLRLKQEVDRYREFVMGHEHTSSAEWLYYSGKVDEYKHRYVEAVHIFEMMQKNM